jgi:hypothetical protein
MAQRTIATDQLLAILAPRDRGEAMLEEWLHDFVQTVVRESRLPRGPIRGTFTATLTWEPDAQLRGQHGH